MQTGPIVEGVACRGQAFFQRNSNAGISPNSEQCYGCGVGCSVFLTPICANSTTLENRALTQQTSPSGGVHPPSRGRVVPRCMDGMLRHPTLAVEMPNNY